MLVITDISKTTRNYTAIPAFSLTLHAGDSAAIRCTPEASRLLLDILLGQTAPSAGQIELNGRLWSGASPRLQAAFIRSDESVLPRLTAREYLHYWQQLFESDVQPTDALALTGLQPHADLLIRKLDVAEQKRLQLARSIVQNPVLFVLENPGQNMDQESFNYLTATIAHLKQSGKMVLATATAAEQAAALSDNWYKLTGDGLIPMHAVGINPDAPASPAVNGQAAAESPTVTAPAEPLFDIGKIPAKNEDSIILFNAPEINYVESSDGASLLYVNGQAYPCSLNLSQLEKRLQPFGFYRCHRSYLVNLQQVRAIEAWTKDSFILKLDDGKRSTVPLSKSKYMELKEHLGL